MQVNKWTINSLSRYWAGNCALCGVNSLKDSLFCQGCLDDICSKQPVCQRCALPLQQVESVVCGSCQTSPPAYGSVYSFAPYQAPLDQLILKFKFQQKLSIGYKLGLLMAQDIQRRQLAAPDVLIPVPLHAKRLRQRGYNQALELARPVAKHLGLALDVSSCIRHRLTQEQMRLPARKRESNLKGAFSANKRFDDKHVVIIDDVMTTGSTVNELAQQLVRAGASQVGVWVCARAAV